MTARDSYVPGPAVRAGVHKDGDRWTLILVRELRHPAAVVWDALTDPDQLREWAPFDADRNLDATGPARLATVGTPVPHISQTNIVRADAPNTLEYSWGGNEIRWELEQMDGGTRLTLWHSIGRSYIAMGAAGWHICFDVLEQLLQGSPIGRIVGGDAMQFGWPRLNAEYAEQFGFEQPHNQQTRKTK